MTPETAEYYRAMLLVGLGDKFYRAFDEALEQEEPLPDLILSLCTCISDETEVLRILREYTLNHPFDDQAVCNLILEDIRGRYLAGELSRAQVVSSLYEIVIKLDKFREEPWQGLTDLSYDLEIWEDGLISEEVFNQCFDSWFFQGKRLDAWELQKALTKEPSTFLKGDCTIAYRSALPVQECIERIAQAPRRFSFWRIFTREYEIERVSDFQLMITFTKGHNLQSHKSKYLATFSENGGFTFITMKFLSEKNGFPHPFVGDYEIKHFFQQRIEAVQIIA